MTRQYSREENRVLRRRLFGIVVSNIVTALLIIVLIQSAFAQVAPGLGREVNPRNPIKETHANFSYSLLENATIKASFGGEEISITIQPLDRILWDTKNESSGRDFNTLQLRQGSRSVDIQIIKLSPDTRIENTTHFRGIEIIVNGTLGIPTDLTFDVRGGITHEGNNIFSREFRFDYSDMILENNLVQADEDKVRVSVDRSFSVDPQLVVTNFGFETGDFTGWFSVRDDTANEVRITPFPGDPFPIIGNFSAFFDYQSDGNNKRLMLFQPVTVTDEIFLRVLVNITSEGLAPGDHVGLAGIKNDGGNPSVDTFRTHLAVSIAGNGSRQFSLFYLDDNAQNNQLDFMADDVPLNTVFNITLRYKFSFDPNDGIAEVTIDDVVRANVTIDNDLNGDNLDTIFNGVSFSAGKNVTFKTDNTAISTTPGFEPPEDGVITIITQISPVIVAFGPIGVILFLIMGLIFLFLASHFKVLVWSIISSLLFLLSIIFFIFPLSYIIDANSVVTVQTLPLFPTLFNGLFVIFLMTFLVLSFFLSLNLTGRPFFRRD